MKNDGLGDADGQGVPGAKNACRRHFFTFFCLGLEKREAERRNAQAIAAFLNIFVRQHIYECFAKRVL